MFFFWDNLGWGEPGCYGGGVLRGAATPRIDSLAAEGLRLLNFNVEPQCTPGELRAEEHIQLGVITQFVTTRVRSQDRLTEPHHGVGHSAG